MKIGKSGENPKDFKKGKAAESPQEVTDICLV